MKRELRRWGDRRFCRDGTRGNAVAFCLRLVRRQPRRGGVFRCERIDLGAHEAAVSSVFRFCGGGVYRVFRGVPQFLRRQGGVDPAGTCRDPDAFYTCAGAFGELPGWGNILIFFLADALAYLVGYRWLTDGRLRGGAMQLAGFALLWALLFAFVWFTYRTPHLPLFLDPVSGCYGVQVPC